MTKKIATVFYLLYLILFNSLSAQILQFENQVIEKIDVVIYKGGETICDSHAILARMCTKEGGIFSQVDFDEDLKTLSQDFDRIEPVIETQDHQVYITLNLWPKPIIHSIHWHGNHKISTSSLEKELDISCRSVFDRQAFNQAFHKLRAYYISKGFFEAELDYHINMDAERNIVDIQIDIQEGRSGKIQEIVFINFDEHEKHEVLKEMVTKKYNIFMSWYTNEGLYNEEAMQQDQLVITNYLQNEGYADAQVDISIAESTKTERIIVTITADKGERYYFGSLSFEGNTLFTDEQIDALFQARPGEPFSLISLSETIEALSDAYGKFGYIDTIVDFEPQLVEGEYLYNVHFKIEEGQQYRVGLIRVFGNISTKTSVILHETLLVPGEIFNSVKLKRTEQRLRNIGYFKNVNVYIVKGTESCGLSDDGNYRDVYIEVEETNTGNFSAFLGYSSVEELFGGINITERNFNHEGFSFIGKEGLCALRGGGEYAHFTAQIGQKSRSYVLSWTKPYFLDTKWTVGVDISRASTRYVSKDYSLETAGLLLRANYNINQFVRAGLHYRLKNGTVDLHEDHSINELEEEARIHGLISAVGASLTYDSTDHPIRPRRGFRSKLMVEFAGVGGDHMFFNIGYLNSYYIPVGSRNVLRYRADFRFLQPLGNTWYETMPLDERIFLGGEFTVRGYRPYRLGPQYPGTHIPRGGLSLQLYSVEFVRRLTKDIELFAFFDAGQLSKNTWEFGRLSASLGYGTRFKLIESIPPITLGMGYPLNARDRSEVKRFFISVGGNF